MATEDSLSTTGIVKGKKTTTLLPTRSYSLPGGPYAASLGNTELKVLAEITRGGDDDRNAGR